MVCTAMLQAYTCSTPSVWVTSLLALQLWVMLPHASNQKSARITGLLMLPDLRHPRYDYQSVKLGNLEYIVLSEYQFHMTYNV